MAKYSGRLSRRSAEFLQLEDENDELDLLLNIARSTTIRNKVAIPRQVTRYSPMYKHPLPISERRYNHEMILNRVLSCKVEEQAAAAISQSDPWVLEEVYMRGAPVEVPCSSGYRPIHLAVSKNLYECVMVLLHIGVNINVVTVSGVTPLYLAYASNSTQTIQVLLEKGAVLRIDPKRIAPGVTVLEVEKPILKEDKIVKYLGLPNKHHYY